MDSRLILAVIAFLAVLPSTLATHHGCNYTDADPYTWECDFQNWPRLPYQMWTQNLTDFTNPIRKLRLYNVDLYIDSNMFSNLGTFAPADDSANLTDWLTAGAAAAGAGTITTNFDLSTSYMVDYQREPELEIQCVNSDRGYLALYNDSFVGLEWIRRITIKNCRLAGFDDGPFKIFTNLTTFRVLDGIFNDMTFTAMQGMNIYPTDVPGSGLVEITSRFPFNFLYFYMIDPLKGATTLTVRGNDMNRVQTSMVSQFTDLTRLDLSYNEYYYLPETLFTSNPKLANLEVYGIKWFCYCTGTWIFEWAEENNALIQGDFICEYPSSFKGFRLWDYRVSYCNLTNYYGVQFEHPDDVFVHAVYWILISGMFLILLFSLMAIIFSCLFMKRKSDPVAAVSMGNRRRPPKVETEGRVQGWK